MVLYVGIFPTHLPIIGPTYATPLISNLNLGWRKWIKGDGEEIRFCWRNLKEEEKFLQKSKVNPSFHYFTHICDFISFLCWNAYYTAYCTLCARFPKIEAINVGIIHKMLCAFQFMKCEFLFMKIVISFVKERPLRYQTSPWYWDTYNIF